MTAIIMSFEKRLLTISKILAPYISMFLSFSSYGITLVKGPNLPSMIMLVAGIFLANFGGIDILPGLKTGAEVNNFNKNWGLTPPFLFLF